MMKRIMLAMSLAALAVAARTDAGTGSGLNYTQTPNLHLLEPIPGVTGALGIEPSGTSWMELQNRSFSLLDIHNHAPGYGVAVPTAGININADLGFGGFNATLLRSARFSDQPATLSLAGDVRSVYASGGNLYFNNGSGTPIQITSGSGVAGTPGSIGGLVSPASVTYSPGAVKYTFQSNVNTSAGLDIGPLTIRQNTTSAAGITLQSPAGLAAAYAVTMPASLPGATLPLTLSSAGLLTAAQVTGSQIASATVTGSNIASGTITTTQISGSAGIMGSQLALTLPGSTLPMVVSPTGALSTQTLTNAQQNFGTPSATTDVAIKSYVDGKFPSLTSSWQTLTGSAGNWTQTSSGIQFMKDAGGSVRFRMSGALVAGAGSPTQVGTLPVGFRPSSARFLLVTQDPAVYPTQPAAYITITTVGTIIYQAGRTNGEYVNLDAASFVVDQ